MKEELPPQLNNLFEGFKEVFSKDTRYLTQRHRIKLQSLGFVVYGYAHPKIKIGDTVITLYTSASDAQINRVVLRRIRKTLINEFKKGNIEV